MRIFLILIGVSFYVFANSGIESLVSAAKKGDVKAIFKLGYIYENGIEVKANLTKAYKFYKKAASMGDEDAIIALSLLELNKSHKSSRKINNKVLVKDNSNFLQLDSDELKELIKRAKDNDSEALFTLASLYESGFNNIKSDSKRAKLLYQKAAKLGSKKAKEVLKRMK